MASSTLWKALAETAISTATWPQPAAKAPVSIKMIPPPARPPWRDPRPFFPTGQPPGWTPTSLARRFRPFTECWQRSENHREIQGQGVFLRGCDRERQPTYALPNHGTAHLVVLRNPVQSCPVWY